MIFAQLSSCSFRLARRYLMNLTSVYFYFEIRSLYDFYLKIFISEYISLKIIIFSGWE